MQHNDRLIQKSKKYYIHYYRTILFGTCSLLIGLFALWMLIPPYPKFDISYLFILPVIGIISITTIYFGCKTLLNFNKVIQLELQDHELKYLIVGKGRGAGLNYFINPAFKKIRYSNIKSVTISTENCFEKHIQVFQYDGSKIAISLLYQNEKELEQIVSEIKRRLI